ncbi:hypothetical protein LT493_42600 [Streptomyces tricolor]|nr:hypothetical protein [Streptomyces tricolor]
MADRLGWTWDGTPDRPVLLTGRPSGAARLRPVGTGEERYVDGESYVELAVPLASAAPDAAAQAAAFRAARQELTTALGTPSVLGSYGDMGPVLRQRAAVGSPFVRWRGRPDTLELRAGTSGAGAGATAHGPGGELVLAPGHRRGALPERLLRQQP